MATWQTSYQKMNNECANSAEMYLLSVVEGDNENNARINILYHHNVSCKGMKNE